MEVDEQLIRRFSRIFGARLFMLRVDRFLGLQFQYKKESLLLWIKPPEAAAETTQGVSQIISLHVFSFSSTFVGYCREATG